DRTMTLSHADMVKIEKSLGRHSWQSPRYDKPQRKIGTRIKDGDRSIRVGAMVECFDAAMWPDTYGRQCQDVTGQVWSRASKPGHWFVVTEQGYAYEVHQKAMRVVQGAGEQ